MEIHPKGPRGSPETSSSLPNSGVLSNFSFMLQPQIWPLSPPKSRFKVLDAPGAHPDGTLGVLTSIKPACRYQQRLYNI